MVDRDRMIEMIVGGLLIRMTIIHKDVDGDGDDIDYIDVFT